MIVRVHGIKKVRSKGRVYHYHRKTHTRIKAKPGTLDFIAEVRRLDTVPELAVVRSKQPGTLGALIVAYRQSPEFAGKADTTRERYQEVFDYLAGIEDVPLASLDSKAFLKIRDKAYHQRKRWFANYVKTVSHLVFAWGMPHGLVGFNPVSGVRRIPAPKGAPKVNRAWIDNEDQVVLNSATGGLRVGVALGMFAAMRLGDVINITWSAYDGQTIQWRQGKTDNPVWLPAHRELRAILDHTPRTSLNIVTKQSGEPYSLEGFSKVFRNLIKRLLDEKSVMPGLTFHGLRHTAAKRLADVGCEPRTIAAVLGHRSLQMALHYSEEVDQRKRAIVGIRALERPSNK
jgi:integrase